MSLFALEMTSELVAAPNPRPVDVDLGGTRDAFLLHEGVDVFAAFEDVLLDVEVGFFEHLLGADSKRTFVIGEYHPVEHGAFIAVFHEELNRSTPAEVASP